MKYYLGIDVGSSESKATLLDEHFSAVKVVSCAHDLLNPRPGHFEHDAEKVWWGDLCRLTHRIFDECGVRPEEIAAVGCSALGADLVPVDENCVPLRNAILYGIDSRAQAEIDALNEKYGPEKVMEFNGRPLCSSDVPPKMQWLAGHEPDIFTRAHKLLTASSFLTARLTGRYTIDRFLAYGPFAPLYSKTDGSPNMEYVPEFCRPDQLAEVHETTAAVGTVTARAAADSGLAEGTPVITGTDDSAAEAVSAGVIEDGDLMLQLGSSLYMIGVCPQIIADRRVWSGGFLIPGRSCVQGGTNAAGTLTKWYRNEIFADVYGAERSGGENAFAVMSREAGMVPPGAEGLIQLPYIAGERTPINDPFAKGMLFGLTIRHTRKHMYRAAMESIGYTIRQHLDIFSENGITFRRICAVGGGAKSDEWLQIIADITGCRIEKADTSSGASFGDALMAAIGIGDIAGFPELRKVIGGGRYFLPDPANRDVYDRNYGIYKELYLRTKDLMRL